MSTATLDARVLPRALGRDPDADVRARHPRDDPTSRRPVR
jgi:hypothetical protein